MKMNTFAVCVRAHARACVCVCNTACCMFFLNDMCIMCIITLHYSTAFHSCGREPSRQFSAKYVRDAVWDNVYWIALVCV